MEITLGEDAVKIIVRILKEHIMRMRSDIEVMTAAAGTGKDRNKKLRHTLARRKFLKHEIVCVQLVVHHLECELDVPPIDPDTGRPANFKLPGGNWITIAERD